MRRNKSASKNLGHLIFFQPVARIHCPPASTPLAPPPSRCCSTDSKEQERKNLGHLIYAYSRQRIGIYPLYYGIDWTVQQKAR